MLNRQARWVCKSKPFENGPWVHCGEVTHVQAAAKLAEGFDMMDGDKETVETRDAADPTVTFRHIVRRHHVTEVIPLRGDDDSGS